MRKGRWEAASGDGGGGCPVTWSDCVVVNSGGTPVPLPGVDCSLLSLDDLLIGADGSCDFRFRPVGAAFVSVFPSRAWVFL